MAFYSKVKENYGKAKDKFIDKFFIRGEEYDSDPATDENTAEQQEEEQEDSSYEDEFTPPPYNYSPTEGFEPPEYRYSGSSRSSAGNSSASANSSRGSARSSFTPPAFSASNTFRFNAEANSTPNASGASTERKTTNIYSMSSIRPVNKFKLNSITLSDVYGAKDVALMMMEKDSIIIVSFCDLTEKQKKRATDFLDGARCVTKSMFARLNDNVLVFAPENVELCGDFESQLDFDSIR